MKRLEKIISLASLFLLLAAPVAFATPYVVAGDSIQLTGTSGVNWTGYNGYGAGVMNYYVSGNGVKTFQIGTFCIQDNVDIGWGKYTVGNVSDIVGWSTSKPSGDSAISGEGPLKGDVNWIYEQYANGKFGTLNSANQADFQNLLWYLQGEDTIKNGTPYSTIGTTFSTNSAWYNDYINNYVNGNLAARNPSGQYGTEVLNIVDASGIVQQNQLVYQPVPEPSTFTLLMVGTGLLGLFFRRFRAARNLS